MSSKPKSKLSENIPTDIFSNSISNFVLEAVQLLSAGRFLIEAPEKTGMHPLFNSINQLMDDNQSSLAITLINKGYPLSIFPMDGADTDVDAGAQEDLYSREAKERAPRERAEEAMNSTALTVVSEDSMNSLMEVRQQSVKRARPLSPPSPPDRKEKIQLRERSLNTSPLPLITFTLEESKQSMEEIGAEASPATAKQPPAQASVSFPVRAHHGDNSASFKRQAAGSGGGPGTLPASSGFSHVPLSRNAVHLVKSLSRASAPRSGGLGLYGSYRPDWIKKKRSALRQRRPCRPYRSLCCGPAISRRRISWSPTPSVPSLKGASPAQASPPSNPGPYAVTPLSWAKVVGNSNLALTQTCQSDNSNVWTPVQRRNSRAQKHRQQQRGRV